MKMIFLAAAALTVIPGTAMAQDALPFSGPYIGALAGWDHVKVGADGDSGSKDGVVYGGVVGYDYNLGAAVVGAEAEVTGSSTKETQNDVFALGDTARIKAGRDLYVGARFGTVVGDNMLLYVKGGYTNARVTVNYDDNDGNAFEESDNLDGYRLGAGAEYSFGRFATRLEYRYSDYGNLEFDDVDTGIDAKRHQVVLSLLGRF